MNSNTNQDQYQIESTQFYNRLNEFNVETPGRMYILEVTKLCGYSTFVYMYKDETLLDLYNRVSHHFGCKDIKGLYIDNLISGCNLGNHVNSNNCCSITSNNKYIPIPISSLTTIRSFIFDNSSKEPRNLKPIYSLPLPVVYRIYLDDGHSH